MKELSIEEKAKRYDEAIRKAKSYYDEGKTLEYANDIVSDIFPELKENEDERIRKKIIKFIKVSKPEWENYRDYSSWIAWLEKQGDIDRRIQEEIEKQTKQQWKAEKQGEHKPIVIIPKYRIGDEIKSSNEESLIITKIDGKGYWSEDLFICDFYEECLWDLVENNHTWKPSDELKQLKKL